MGAVLDGILHSMVTSAVDLRPLKELCLVIQLKIILTGIHRLRDTVRTFQQVKSQLDSTLEAVKDRRMMAIQDGIQYLAL